MHHHDEVTNPAHLGFTTSTASTAERRVTDASQLAERRSVPLYEETRRAAGLRSDPDPSFLFTDEYARQWQTHEPVRRSWTEWLSEVGDPPNGAAGHDQA